MFFSGAAAEHTFTLLPAIVSKTSFNRPGGPA